MNILLTNDDGIKSEGLQKLAEILRSRLKHRVYVIAPDHNRSGISHALSLISGPVKLTRQEEDTWSCSGFPADCVILGLMGELPVRPDLIISGINQGENLGTDIIYSGTASAARQGSLAGIPALALSLAGRGDFCWDMAASWSADHLGELVALWRENTFVNVNIPNCPGGPEGMAMAWPAVKRYQDILKVMPLSDDTRWFFLAAGEELAVKEAGSDWDVVSRNLVSVSPVYNYPAVRRDLCPGVPEQASVAPPAPKKGEGTGHGG